MIENDYIIGRTLGEGAFSKVKLGTHRKTKEKVAIKIINKIELANTYKRKEKQRREREKQKLIQQRYIRDNNAVQFNAAPIANNIHNIGENNIFDPDIELKLKSQEEAKKRAQQQRKADKHKEVMDQMPGKFSKNLQKEVRILQQLNHPNIVKLYEVVETDIEFYIVMEYVGGGEIVDYIAKRRKLSEGEAKVMFLQIVSAIGAVHAMGIIHRDIKLENILMSEDKRIVVSDFGLGRTFQHGEVCYTFCGTPLYAAPELVSGIEYFGPPTDVWALGVVLYTMVTGNSPFTSKSMAGLYKNIKEVQYQIPPYIKSSLIDLLRAILVKDPDSRITVADIAAHPWLKIDKKSQFINQLPKELLVFPNDTSYIPDANHLQIKPVPVINIDTLNKFKIIPDYSVEFSAGVNGAVSSSTTTSGNDTGQSNSQGSELISAFSIFSNTIASMSTLANSINSSDLAPLIRGSSRVRYIACEKDSIIYSFRDIEKSSNITSSHYGSSVPDDTRRFSSHSTTNPSKASDATNLKIPNHHISVSHLLLKKARMSLNTPEKKEQYLDSSSHNNEVKNALIGYTGQPKKSESNGQLSGLKPLSSDSLLISARNNKISIDSNNNIPGLIASSSASSELVTTKSLSVSNPLLHVTSKIPRKLVLQTEELALIEGGIILTPPPAMFRKKSSESTIAIFFTPNPIKNGPLNTIMAFNQVEPNKNDGYHCTDHSYKPLMHDVNKLHSSNSSVYSQFADASTLINNDTPIHLRSFSTSSHYFSQQSNGQPHVMNLRRHTLSSISNALVNGEKIPTVRYHDRSTFNESYDEKRTTLYAEEREEEEPVIILKNNYSNLNNFNAGKSSLHMPSELAVHDNLEDIRETGEMSPISDLPSRTIKSETTNPTKVTARKKLSVRVRSSTYAASSSSSDHVHHRQITGNDGGESVINTSKKAFRIQTLVNNQDCDLYQTSPFDFTNFHNDVVLSTSNTCNMANPITNTNPIKSILKPVSLLLGDDKILVTEDKENNTSNYDEKARNYNAKKEDTQYRNRYLEKTKSVLYSEGANMSTYSQPQTSTVIPSYANSLKSDLVNWRHQDRLSVKTTHMGMRQENGDPNFRSKHNMKSEKEIDVRVVKKGIFNMIVMTTRLNIFSISQEISKVLLKMNLNHICIDNFDFYVVYQSYLESVLIEIEIVKLWLLGLPAVRIKRVAGSIWLYKEIHMSVQSSLTKLNEEYT